LPEDRYANDYSRIIPSHGGKLQHIEKCYRSGRKNPSVSLGFHPSYPLQRQGQLGQAAYPQLFELCSVKWGGSNADSTGADRSEELKATEDGVKEHLTRSIPGREIVGIDTESLNLWAEAYIA
jgi:hypothetical protein